MKKIKLITFAVMLMCSTASEAQKTISEGSIVYNIVIQTNAKEPTMADALDGATSTVYLKGGLSKTTMVSSLGSESTIHNTQIGDAVILKEYSGQKLMISLNKDNWISKNKKYDGITFQKTNETATIVGYNCIKAIAKLKDGTNIIVYYTPDITVLNKEYDQTFKSLPGLAMQYEYESDKMKFKYTVSKIDFNSLPNSVFDYPKSGYRVLPYVEKN